MWERSALWFWVDGAPAVANFCNEMWGGDGEIWIESSSEGFSSSDGYYHEYYEFTREQLRPPQKE